MNFRSVIKNMIYSQVFNAQILLTFKPYYFDVLI